MKTGTVIGPAAKKPLRLDIPILISGMAYGLGLNASAKTALARAAAVMGTAANTGEGGLLPAERQAAKYLIVQFHRGGWLQLPEVLSQADAIEIQAGQGASVSAPVTRRPETLDRETLRSLGLEPGQEASIGARHPGVSSPDDFLEIVRYCRRVSGGVPVGFKIAGTNSIERDLEIAVRCEADFVAVDGAQGGSHVAPATLQDDFGLPTLISLVRAARFLEHHGLKGRISLIVGGGLITPGEFLKCLALGADACYIGTAALFAAAHSSVSRALPWEPLTQLIWQRGRLKDRLDQAGAEKGLVNYLRSCVSEMVIGAERLGKTALSQVGRADLCALTPEIAQITGVRPAETKT